MTALLIPSNFLFEHLGGFFWRVRRTITQQDFSSGISYRGWNVPRTSVVYSGGTEDKKTVSSFIYVHKFNQIDMTCELVCGERVYLLPLS